MDSTTYSGFFRRCLRNNLVATLLAVLPAFCLYLSVFEFTARQVAIIGASLSLVLAVVLPLDAWILHLTLRPVRRALEPDASSDTLRAGLVRLLDSPLLVLLRVFGPHTIVGACWLAGTVIAGNRFLELDVPLTPGMWAMNLLVVPIAHAVYEFTAMERELQPVAVVLRRRLGPEKDEPQTRGFSIAGRVRVFVTLLIAGPQAVLAFAVFVRVEAISAVQANRLLWAVVPLIVVSVGLGIYLMKRLADLIREQTGLLLDGLDRLGRGELDSRIELHSTSELGVIAERVNRVASLLGERQKLRDLFGAYMTNDVAEALLAKEGSGRTEKRFLAIVFVDVRGFTGFSHGRPAEQVVSVLNRLLQEAVEAVASHGGNVNKYLGDGLLAIFGAPTGLASPCASAVAAAVDLSERIMRLNRELESEGLPPMRIGVGIHAGEVVVGSIGAPRHKLEYTVIGDAVNVAARIEQLNKSLGSEILVSEQVFQAANERCRDLAGPPMVQRVAGVEAPLTVYSLNAHPAHVTVAV